MKDDNNFPISLLGLNILCTGHSLQAIGILTVCKQTKTFHLAKINLVVPNSPNLMDNH